MNTQGDILNYTTKQKLSDAEIVSIKELEEKNNREKHIFYKIDPQSLITENASTTHILFSKNNVLHSYAYMNVFDGEVLECTILSVESTSELTALYEVILQKAKIMGVQKILLIIDKNDADNIEFVKNIGFIYSFSEHRMFFDNEKFKFHDSGKISLHNATIDDSRLILELDDAQVHLPLDEDDILSTKIAKQDNEIVGKVRVDKVGDIAGIYGFVVKPELRGKGLGREILNSTINECFDNGYREIYLEVESENWPALHLYESVGFKIRATFDYFETII